MTKLPAVDAVVIGMGLTGTIVAKELADAGVKVVGLERGRMVDPRHDFAMPYVHDELKHDRHSDLVQNLSRETITFRNSRDERALPMREIGSFKPGEAVGGAGMLWGGVASRFVPWDFETRSRLVERYGAGIIPEDCTSQDWGLGYDELEPYYDQFEHLYGVGGKAGNLAGEIVPGGNTFEGPRTREFPNPPSDPSYSGHVFAKAAESLGYRPFPLPAATMTRAYTNPNRLQLGECVYGGFCAHFTCAMGAKATPWTTVLPVLLKHRNFTLRPHANVVRINTDSTGRRATGVTYIDARGNEVEQPADLVVVASYVLNNVRLLLLSGIGKPYDPVANTGVVGRNYAYQTIGAVTLFFDDRYFNPFMGGSLGVAIDEFNNDNFDHTGLGFIGGGVAYATSRGMQAIRSIPVPAGTPRWGAEWKKAVAKYYVRHMTIATSGSCQSYRGHYLDLDPTYRDVYGLPLLRMTFDWHDNEKRMSAFVTGKAAEIARAIAPPKMNVTAVTGRYSIVPYQSTHNTGGAVMGADPTTSVVNRYLQSWDAHNVFVVGASAFPQNSANHPTCTSGALACWAADAIKDQYLRNPGPLV